jgi:endogenous inhibitor of DNA gyrase (YacG/DUF329 family)
MTKARCPICSKTFEVDQTTLPPGFPFCSERCRLIDLGRWIDGDYAIPGRPVAVDPNQPSGDAPPPVVDEDLDDYDA